MSKRTNDRILQILHHDVEQGSDAWRVVDDTADDVVAIGNAAEGSGVYDSEALLAALEARPDDSFDSVCDALAAARLDD